jgi:serine/threonine protein kinase
MNFKVIQSDGHIESLFVDETAKLGRGATANVYRVHFDGKDLAAKIYHQGRLFNKDKIRAMLENPPDDREVISHGQEYPQFAWPLFIIWDKTGNEVGFLMPLVDTHESFTLDHYYDLGLFKKLNSPDEAALSYKLEIAKNLSRLVADLHSHGHFFIDCKPQNIRVFKRNHVVTLIDCDGFSIKGINKRFPAELLSTDYISPEAQRNNTLPADLGEFQDRYALAVILFQLLNRGTHPFQGLLTDNNLSFNTNDEKAAVGLYPYGIVPNPRIKPRPQSTHHLWCEETRILFDQAFANGSPVARPSAHEWADHFESLLTTKSLVRCEKYPNDVSHMRFRNMRCSACYLKALPIFVPPTVGSKQPEQTVIAPRPGATKPTPAAKQTLQSTYKPPSSNNTSVSLGVGSFVGVIILIIIYGIYFSNNSSPPVQTTTSARTTTSIKTTYPIFEYAPDALAPQNLASFANSVPTDFGKYSSMINRARSTPRFETVLLSSGHHVRQQAIDYLSIGWGPIKEKETNYYPLAYWANYQSLLLGYPEGASNLGYMHEFGLGVPIDYEKAAYWYVRAIELGQPHSDLAEFHLANLLQEGSLGKVDLISARQLFLAAIEVGRNGNWKSELRTKAIDEGIRKNTRIIDATSSATTSQSQDKYISLYVSSVSRISGQALSHDSQDQADQRALRRCQERASGGSEDKCMKVVSDRGKCLGISVSKNLAVGAAIRNTFHSAGMEAQYDCLRMGGKYCPYEPEKTSCLLDQFPTDRNPLSVNTTKPNSQPPQVISTPHAKVTYSSMYMTFKSRLEGYSLSDDTESESNDNALKRCNSKRSLNDPQDTCIKVVSAEGKCVAISRASNGAIGAAVGEKPASLSVVAESNCLKEGGKDCSSPYLVGSTFCAQ